MAKISIFSDLHLGVRKNSPRWHAVALQWADWYTDLLRKESVKDIVFLGDFFHKRDTISTHTLHVAAQFIEKFKDFNLHLILGNHDLFLRDDPEISAVNLLGGYPNVKIYQHPESVQFGDKTFLMCGWGYNPLEYSADYLFTHAEINTFAFESSATCEADLQCSDLLKHYKHVISGHFHTQQRREYDFGTVEYLGSPYAMDFHDEGKTKYVMLLDTETDERKLVPYPHSPRFVSYVLSELIKNDDLESVVKSINGSFCRIKIDKNISVTDLNELHRLVSICSPVEFRSEYLIDDKIDPRKKDIDCFSLEEAIKEYVINVAQLPQGEELTNYLVSLYKEVTAEQ